MDSVDSVFLDTTIQLYRIAYGPDMKRDIDAVLAQVEQVEQEMKHATLKDGKDDQLLRALGWLKGADGNYDFVNKLRVPKRWNWALGDLLIALEAPSGAAIYSADRSFSILCRALGKTWYTGKLS